jgi:hypothetical protein
MWWCIGVAISSLNQQRLACEDEAASRWQH